MFVVLVFGVLFLLPGDTGVRVGRSLFFVLGAAFSAAIGYFGMSLAVRANVRVAAAARDEGRDPAMRVAFRTTVVGAATVGLGLLGAATVVRSTGAAAAVLEGFGFGAALLAMFMRVGGGIFTKAADVGADLVGKVEAGIPEDDPRNAATIADNVRRQCRRLRRYGSGPVRVLRRDAGRRVDPGQGGVRRRGLVFPLVVPAINALTAVLGIYLTRPRPGERPAHDQPRLLRVRTSRPSSARWPPMPTCQPVPRARRRHQHDGDPRSLAALAVIVGIVLAGIIL